jgi:hypothetical protein
MVQSTVFIGAIIIAVTQFIKFVAPKVNGELTILAAIIVGVVVALLDTHIGIADISVAQGVLTALGAVGVHSVASQVG